MDESNLDLTGESSLGLSKAREEDKIRTKQSDSQVREEQSSVTIPRHEREGSFLLTSLFDSPGSSEFTGDFEGSSTTVNHSNQLEEAENAARKLPENTTLQSETSPLISSYDVPHDTFGSTSFENDPTPKISVGARKRHMRTPSQLPPIGENTLGTNGIAAIPPPSPPTRSLKSAIVDTCRSVCRECAEPTTWIGAFMFSLFQVVFSLTMGAAITRPHGTRSMLGLFTKMAALGIMFGASGYWVGLSSDIPSLYPTVDLFTAPFLAAIAALVDEELFNDPNVKYDEADDLFLGTFTLLASVSMMLSATLLVVASLFKLANLAAFLPFPVISGFFASVGVLTWTLSVKIDTGMSVGQVLSSDFSTMQNCFVHHLPSVAVAAIMKYLGPKNPFYVVAVIFATITMFHAYRVAFGVSLEEMVQAGWFWSSSDLLYEKYPKVGFSGWVPPTPLGWINCLLGGRVHWGAVWKGMDTAVALGFLYLMRCSIHGAAMKKNVRNLERKSKSKVTVPVPSPGRKTTRHRRKFSEALDIENIVVASGQDSTEDTVKAKPTNLPLKDILIQYGYSQFVCAAVGSFAVTPSVAASGLFFTLGAEKVAPQVGSVLILLGFYLTSFRAVEFIPKPAFSSLLVLAFIDMILTWFVNSWLKTKEKLEWLVVPLIIVLAFVVGLLQAVFLGLAMSTFFFVATFFRSGVVKYIANGVIVRSTVERRLKDAKRLDQTGDAIQIMVLQNYLFFGNANSILSYIQSMFDDPEEDIDPVLVSPVPKVVIIDLTLVTGMDTSAVDAFSDILSLCQNFNCKLFLSGVAPSLRQVMALGGVKPENTVIRSERKLRFFSSLDAAVGKAEDLILYDDFFDPVAGSKQLKGESGFVHALRQIDMQHEETTAAKDLAPLEAFMELHVLRPQEMLYETYGCDRGLFFIESGMIKIERSSDMTATRGGGEDLSPLSHKDDTLNGLKAQTGSLGRATAAIKMSQHIAEAHYFRVARVGPGWIIGSLEALSGNASNASTIAVTDCRLHYISFKKIEELEESNHLVVLKLYKLLSYMMAKRQEVTIGQLGTLHAIMGAPALKKPTGRSHSRLRAHVSSFYSYD